MATSVPLNQILRDNTISAAPELVRPREGQAVQCLACGHRCVIQPGHSGVCRVRFNVQGKLRVPGGYVAGAQVDPIEKKPFYHVFPGAEALSFGMLGCDFHCSFCQNWVSSQAPVDAGAREGQFVPLPNACTAEQLVQLAVANGAPVAVSTYNEPLITADWAVEVFKLARAEGIVCGLVSNGYATPEVLEFIRPYVDLCNVDLKSFNPENYHRLGGKLEVVLDTIRRLRQLDVWVEVVTLVVPGFNDGAEELTQIAEFVAGVSPDIPWHVTAFHPSYKMTDRGRTPAETLARACELGEAAGLRYVYAGNLPGGVKEREHTCCHACGARLITRFGFNVRQNRMAGSSCPDCHTMIPGVWQSALASKVEGPEAGASE